MDKELILYSYIYMKVRDHSKTNIILIGDLKEVLLRTIYRKGGIPKFMIKEVIEDLIKLGLIERISFNTYRVIEDKCYKKIKQRVACFC